jgi:hypothetical protein
VCWGRSHQERPDHFVHAGGVGVDAEADHAPTIGRSEARNRNFSVCEHSAAFASGALADRDYLTATLTVAL